MILTILATLTVACGLVPLIQRDLKAAYRRQEARRRWSRLHPMVRLVIEVQDNFSAQMRAIGRALDGFGQSYAAVRRYELERSRERAAARKGLR